ncbi:HD domain-containing protein [Thermosulfuriphilus sp.]
MSLDHRLAKFLFEAAMLKRTPRTGYQYLGTGEENVAAHSYSTAIIGLVLSEMTPEVDPCRLITLCLLHDLLEARVGDLNALNKLYGQVDERAATDDLTRELPFGNKLKELLTEYQESQTKEALLAHDADQLDMLLSLKEQQDLGNPYAPRWIKFVRRRIKTPEGRRLAEAICETDWASWWLDKFVERGDEG